jgi:hypothetical protein
MSDKPFEEVDLEALATVAGGASRVSSRAGGSNDQLTAMLTQITGSIKALGNQQSGGMDPMMMMVMMMMMGGGGGGGGEQDLVLVGREFRGLDEQDLLFVALRAEVRDVEALHHAGAGEVIDEVDLRDDRWRALDEHGARAVGLELAEPVHPVADATRVDALDLAEIDHGRTRRDLVDEIAELVVLVDDAAELHVAHVTAVLDRRLKLAAHRLSAE